MALRTRVLRDAVSVTDRGEIEVLRGGETAIAYFCPECGKPSKEDHAPGTRVCSDKACRHRFDAADVTPVEVAVAGAPVHPCPQCGKEMKEHHTPAGSRICSNRGCRHVLTA